MFHRLKVARSKIFICHNFHINVIKHIQFQVKVTHLSANDKYLGKTKKDTSCFFFILVVCRLKTAICIRKLGGCCHHYDESTVGSANHFLINEMGRCEYV